MQKKKTAKKKKTVKKKTSPKKAEKKRSQIVNMPEETSPHKMKVICFNMECKLRRAGCYGFEACPGFKSKG